MFLPVSSIPEAYLYRLLPQGVIDLDKRKLIEAVLGGYQDRISDLRSYANSLGELVKPDANLPQISFNVVLVRFTGPTGQIVTRSLDILPTTPSLDDTQALVEWAAKEIQIEEKEIISAVAGTDLLRRVDIDSVSLLAENVGALLYPGLNDETPEQKQVTRQRLLESWFPRLKIKGTAESYAVLGRIIGFDDVAVTPLWSRLVPHLPNDPGSAINDEDFSAKPDQTPAATLPDPRYDPLDFSDGEYYDWSSGPLSEDPTDYRYWPLAVNKRNPFVRVTIVGGSVARPLPGRYTLSGGASNRKASVLLNAGTVVSNLRVDAIADGPTFNGLRVNVVDIGGTAAGLEISDKMSAIKYRSSYFDFKATIAPTITEPAQPSPDLEKNPSLTPDGVAKAPFRPWTGGSVASTVVLFPTPSSSYGAVVQPRIQAAGTIPQFSSAEFKNAERATENLDSLRAATRRVRSKGVGISLHDSVVMAPYANSTRLFVADVGSISGVGTYSGHPSGPEVPEPPYQVFLQAYVGTNPQPTYMDSSSNGTVTVAGDGFLGYYRTTDNYYRLLVSAGTFGADGEMRAFFTAGPSSSVRVEPTREQKANGTVSYLSRPEDEIDETRRYASLHDENPWRRDPVLAGESIDSDIYSPTVLQHGQGVNRVSNSSFELDSNGDGVADGFTVYNNGEIDYIASIVPGRLGGSAQRITFTGGPNNQEQGIIVAGANPAWEPNKTYVLSYYARAAGGHVGRAMWPNFNVYPGVDVLANPLLSSAWQRYAFRLIWGASVEDYGRVYISTDPTGAPFNGEIIFDDLQIEEGTELTGYTPFSQEVEVEPEAVVEIAEPPYQALALSGKQYELAVLDNSKKFFPYRFKILKTPETDPITGSPIKGPLDRLLLALDQSNNLHHVLLIDQVLVSTQYWVPARWKNVVQWVPFNEHPLDSINPYSRYSQKTDSNIRHQNRLWDADRGWFTRFEKGDSVTFESDTRLGHEYTLAFWVKPEAANFSTPPTDFVTVGNSLVLKLTSNASPAVSVFVPVEGTPTPAGSIGLLVNQWRLVLVRVSRSKVDVGYGTSLSSITWSSLEISSDEVMTQTIRVETSSRSFGLHDLTLWNGEKTDEDLNLVRSPIFAPSPVPYPTPYVESLSRDNRYVMRLAQSGFAYPDVEEVVSVPFNPAYAQRYRFDGLYRGDDKFKETGLGDGDAIQASYPLGLRGVDVEGFGRTLLSGSNPPLPGYTEAWGTAPGSAIAVVGPFGSDGGVVQTKTLPSTPWPNLAITNPTQDRIYIKGDDDRVYKVTVDDVGSGPVLVAEREDLPTGAQTVIGSSGKRISVSVAGTNYAVYEKTDASQTWTTPPAYLYRQSQVRVSAPSAFSRWANQNSFGQSLGVAALEENGSLDFSNNEPIDSGVYDLTFDVQNIGTVDDDFEGFSTTISIVGNGGAVLASRPATLLPSGKGTNPRGTTSINITLPLSIGTSWILAIDWNNDRDVPRKGQKRQLAIHGYTARLISPTLYRLSANPLSLTVVDTNSSTIQPGSLLGEINSYGTIFSIRHEAAIYPENSDWPLSNLLTTSTWRRRENIRVLNPTVEPDPVAPLAPVVVSAGPNPNSVYNVGDTALLEAQISGTGTVEAFVWRFWDNTVETTTTPSISKVVTPGIGSSYNGSFSVSVVDRLGNQSTTSSVVHINRAPELEVSATRTSGIFPYFVELSGTATDPDGHSVTLTWHENGTQIATGSPVGYTAQGSTIVIGRATNSGGGVSERRIAFSGSPRQKPRVSPIIRPVSGRISNVNEVRFAVYALDPNVGGPLTFSWSHWNGVSAGATTAVANSNMKFNQITVGLAGQLPGEKTVTVTVTDEEGYSTVVQTTIDLIENVPPVISDVSTPSPGALAGSMVPFSATAIDVDNDPPGYTWNFTSPRAMTLYGGNVLYPSISSDSGGIIQGTLVVDDSNGSTATAPIPPVFLATQFIAPLTVSNVPGFYQTGFNQIITTAEEGAIIRYSEDGSDIFRVTDGIEYTGPFAFLPPAGGVGVKTLKARAFKTGFAPSAQFSGNYQFYDPNAVEASDPEVGGDANLTLVTLQADADSVITTTAGANIPGDTKQVDQNPLLQIPGMSMEALANEPQLPFTPLPMGSTETPLKPTQSFVKLQAPL